MSTSQLIHNAMAPFAMGDVEKYFDKLDSMIGTNSGVGDYHAIAHDCYATSCPFVANQQTKFRITDSQFDVVDMSQGYITVQIEVPLELQLDPIYNDTLFTIGRTSNKTGETNFKQEKHVPTYHKNIAYWFVGLKSSAHLIDSYTVYSNGHVTSCKQIKALHEQAITFNCKSKEQKNCRPHMYTAHENVLQMTDCVCGKYFNIADLQNLSNKISLGTLSMQVCIQLDDLLPLSGMTYFPRFAVGELELELSFNFNNNFVFCQIPTKNLLTSIKKHDATNFLESSYGFMYNYDTKIRTNSSNFNATDSDNTTQTIFKNVDGFELASVIPTSHKSLGPIIKTLTDGSSLVAASLDYIDSIIESRFTQCGDYALGMFGFYGGKDGFNCFTATNNKNEHRSNYVFAYYTIRPLGLTITEAKSHVYGFNLKETAKRNLLKMFQNDGSITIPAQWIDHYHFGQLPTDTEVKMNASMPIYNASMMLFTFPQSDNQLTVSHNPCLENLRIHIGDKVFPTTFTSTLSPQHSEQILTSLGFDKLFSASDELRASLTCPKNMGKYWGGRQKDDSDYMLVCDLMRNGHSVIHDGYTDEHCNIVFEADIMNPDNNTHWVVKDIENYTFNWKYIYNPVYKHVHTAPNIYVVSEAFWIFTPRGGEFVREGAGLDVLYKKEMRLQREHEAVNGI